MYSAFTDFVFTDCKFSHPTFIQNEVNLTLYDITFHNSYMDFETFILNMGYLQINDISL